MQKIITMNNAFIITQKNNIWFGSFPLLSQAGFINGCSCRLHGESIVVPHTLNLALHVGDEQNLVLRNRQRFADALGVDAKKFTTCQQVHGSCVVVVDEKNVGAGALDFASTIAATDALVTKLADVPLLLFYADCTPVLLADPVSGAIGLAHAGWRGTVAGIAAQTVQAMAENFGAQPQNILAAIGPSIGSCCYEVDDFVREHALAQEKEREICGVYTKFFTPVEQKQGHYLLDLWGYNRCILERAGVRAENIVAAEVCTAHNHELFCSYRAENGTTGRMGVCLCRK